MLSVTRVTYVEYLQPSASEVINDVWVRPDSHRMLDRRWTGRSIFQLSNGISRSLDFLASDSKPVVEILKPDKKSTTTAKSKEKKNPRVAKAERPLDPTLPRKVQCTTDVEYEEELQFRQACVLDPVKIVQMYDPFGSNHLSSISLLPVDAPAVFTATNAGSFDLSLIHI